MQYLWLVFLLFLYARAQEPATVSPDWNGDPKVCTVDSSPFPSEPPLPEFPTKAEFSVERIGITKGLDATMPSQLSMYRYLYDYDANSAVVIKNQNGFIDTEYFYYKILKKSTYYRNTFCVVTDIPTIEGDVDGLAAILLPDGTGHVRPLNEFLLFSNNNSQYPIVRPRYIGSSMVRGIPVDQWDTCIINKMELRTVRRTWSFARKNFTMPSNVFGNMAVPIQKLISTSILQPDGTQSAEFDEIHNVLSYRMGITESIDSLAPPKGVFCSNPESGQDLVSLSDVGISWPGRFSVRIDALTSRSSIWQTFHLRMDQNREHKRIRYDYMPTGAADFQTIILDYKDNLTYSIDRQKGSCEIITGIQYPDVSPISKPIEFFIKHEHMLISQPAEKAWEFNGYRQCRGKAIECIIFTAEVDNFSAIIDMETGKPTGEFWTATNIEYGWSIRAPFAPPIPDRPRQFDYPTHLYMKMYRYDDSIAPNPSNVRIDDVEYEFYEMSHDVHSNEFDTSICYRSQDLPYLHLGFVLKISNGNLVDSNHLDRRSLERHVVYAVADGSKISGSRISNIELDHIRFDSSFYVLFTLLGPAPLSNNESSVEAAQTRLRETIDAGKFTFNMTLLDDKQVVFTAQANTLIVSKQFMSIHASWVYANVSNCNISNPNISNCNSSNINGQPLTKQEKYTIAAQVGGVIGGLIVGIVLGFIIVVIVRVNRKEPMPVPPSAISGGFSNISFHKTKPVPPISMRDLQKNVTNTSHA